MPRLSNKNLRIQRNRGAHQRRRTTRGHRMISKFVKYKWYEKEVIPTTKITRIIIETKDFRFGYEKIITKTEKKEIEPPVALPIRRIDIKV